MTRGAMGQIYRARHVALDKPVAIKIMLRPEDEAGQQRFQQEARLACQVRHPHVVSVIDYGRLPEGDPYLVMELLEGPTLQAATEGHPLPAERACHIAIQIIKGLLAIH